MVRKLVLSLIAVLGVSFAIAQNKQISGTVVGGDGMPISGATVIVDGTTTGTTTGSDGSFSLSTRSNATLTISFIGFETQQVAVAREIEALLQVTASVFIIPVCGAKHIAPL